MLAKISLYCILNKERNEVSQDLAKCDKSWLIYANLIADITSREKFSGRRKALWDFVGSVAKKFLPSQVRYLRTRKV